MDRNQRGPRQGQNGNRQRQDPRRGRRGGRYFDRRHRRPNHRGPVLSPQDALLKKYLFLLDAHTTARKKYFEYYYRTDPSQRSKLERQFTQTMNSLNQFETRLTNQEKEILNKILNIYPEDITYTQNRLAQDFNIDAKTASTTENAEGPKDSENFDRPLEISDPHFLQSQKERPSFRSDQEESMGSLEDYKAYKGI